jgi:hypothetical protein
MPHVVLLGDSIFDNAAYTRGSPDVISQVREFLPPGWQASLLAVDGSTTEDVPKQLARLPAGATHLVLSAGGNDALMHLGLFDIAVDRVARSLRALADIAQDFEKKYRRTVTACLERGLPLTTCTIYNGCIPDKEFQLQASTALMVFNDVILRTGIEFGLPMIDLRFVCALPEDYANPIEPSSIGGAKIARCIVSLLTPDPTKHSAAQIVARPAT